MFDCDSYITCYSNRRLFFFSKERNAWNMNGKYVVYLELSSFLVLQNVNSLPESFGKISWSLLDTTIASSHSFCQTWCIYLAVKGFRTEKGIRSAIGSFSRASLAALSKHPCPCQNCSDGTSWREDWKRVSAKIVLHAPAPQTDDPTGQGTGLNCFSLLTTCACKSLTVNEWE